MGIKLLLYSCYMYISLRQNDQLQNIKLSYLMHPKGKQPRRRFNNFHNNLENIMQRQDEDNEDYEQVPHDQQQIVKNDKKRRRKVKQFPTVLQAQTYQPTSVQMLAFVSTIDIYSKIFGHFLVNEKLQVIYADKLAKQLLEMAFNTTFASQTLLDIIVEAQRQQFLNDCRDCIRNLNESFLFLIYSKKTLRKSKLVPEIQTTNNYDIFFRYLNCLRCVLTPILINLRDYQEIVVNNDDAFWNKPLINRFENMKCFIFKINQANYVPNLSHLDLINDKRIIKLQRLARQGKERRKKLNQSKKTQEKQPKNQIQDEKDGDIIDDEQNQMDNDQKQQVPQEKSKVKKTKPITKQKQKQKKRPTKQKKQKISTNKRTLKPSKGTKEQKKGTKNKKQQVPPSTTMQPHHQKPTDNVDEIVDEQLYDIIDWE